MSFVIKLKTKEGSVVVTGLTAKNYVSDLLKVLGDMVSLEPDCINALKGFPPKPLNLQCQEASLEEIGINSGDTLIIEEKPRDTATRPITSSNRNSRSNYSDTLIPSMDHRMAPPGLPGVILRQIIPGDNSCLFTSVGFALYGYVEVKFGSVMRQIIADVVSNEPEKYSAAMLGKPNVEYCSWIMKSESWGGGIELAVLADFFQFEISVVNVVCSNINTFGEENNFTKRAYLMFDGVHYDAIYLQPYEPEVQMKTLFSPTDIAVLDKVKSFSSMARRHRNYTDLQMFTLQCGQCGAGITGEAQAVLHAKLTGHTQFGEVNRQK